MTGTASDRIRSSSVFAWALTGLYVVMLAITLWLDHQVFAAFFPGSGLSFLQLHGIWLGPFLVFAIVGSLVASRRPRQPIGWLLLAAALASALGELLRTYAALEIGTATGAPPLLARLADVPSEPITVAGVVTGVVLIPLLFPTGHPPTRRWRALVWGAGAFLSVFLANNALSPRLSRSLPAPSGEVITVYDVANPLSPAGIPDAIAAVSPGVSTGLLPVLILLAGVAVTLRFRRSQGEERQQLKWFAYAAALVVVAAVSQVVSGVLYGPSPTLITSTLLVAGLSAYPVAIGIAVLRYRLYEIDRIISRTVTYGLVVALLAAVYATAVVALGAAVTAVTGVEDSDLVVAGATLLAVGLFRPIRTRVQTWVDRRFNRTSYEAARAVDAFAHDVRDEVEQERIRRRTAETASTAVQPTHVSVWLADSRVDTS